MKVFDFMEHNSITLDLLPTSDPGNRKRLIEVGGKAQVPCLFIDGIPLYESDEIIEYLRDTFIG